MAPGKNLIINKSKSKFILDSRVLNKKKVYQKVDQTQILNFFEPAVSFFSPQKVPTKYFQNNLKSAHPLWLGPSVGGGGRLCPPIGFVSSNIFCGYTPESYWLYLRYEPTRQVYFFANFLATGELFCCLFSIFCLIFIFFVKLSIVDLKWR